MKTALLTATALLFLSGICITVCITRAEAETAGYQSTVVMINGTSSSLLEGDPLKAADNRKLAGHDVLPLMMAQGWQVKELKVVQIVGTPEPLAYAIIEKRN